MLKTLTILTLSLALLSSRPCPAAGGTFTLATQPLDLWGHQLGTRYVMQPGDTQSVEYRDGKRYRRIYTPTGNLVLDKRTLSIGFSILVLHESNVITFVQAYLVLEDITLEALELARKRLGADVMKQGSTAYWQFSAIETAHIKARMETEEVTRDLGKEWAVRFGATTVKYFHDSKDGSYKGVAVESSDAALYARGWWLTKDGHPVVLVSLEKKGAN